MTAATYTPDELTKISRAVITSGMAIAMVDVGLVSTAIEATALGQEIATAAQKHPNNPIIQAVFSENAIREFKTISPSHLQVKAEEMRPETAIATATSQINEALAVLSSKASAEEVQEYKAFIYSCAEHVARAAGSGLLGTGAKVSEKEASALDSLKQALGL